MVKDNKAEERVEIEEEEDYSHLISPKREVDEELEGKHELKEG